MNQQGISSFAIILIVVGILLIGSGLWYGYNQWPKTEQEKIEKAFEKSLQGQGMTREEWEKTSKESSQMSQDTRVERNVNQIQMSLRFYFDKNKVLPRSLESLYPEFIQEEVLEDNKYLYAHQRDTTIFSYHLGVAMHNPEHHILNKDVDYDSVSLGYVNGFNGKDPIYDVVVIPPDSKPTESNDKDKVANIILVKPALEVYYDGNNSTYPQSLDLLEGLIPTELKTALTQGGYFYARSQDGKKIHIGIGLNSPSSSYLNSDDDFNSATAGYNNGFSGEDPVYDLAY